MDGYAAQRLDLYAQRLVAWNEKMNLTGITDPDGILEKHFIDSIEPLRFVEIPRNARVIDVGTGAGFPGLPLLIARPDLDLTLADSLHKRLVFLKDVLHGCGLVAERVHARAEILGKDPDYREQYDIATARAVAPLPVRILPAFCESGRRILGAERRGGRGGGGKVRHGDPWRGVRTECFI